MNKVFITRDCMLTGEQTEKEIRWKDLVQYLECTNVEYERTAVESGKHYTIHNHMFSGMDQNYYFKIRYENAVIH